MNFAIWRKCDFQIHTPRDPNWRGQRPCGINETIQNTDNIATKQDVDDARKIWATEFIDRCEKKKLTAIAVTDHHDMTMIPYLQADISRRKKENTEFDLWLFPGMELTARGGCQCILLFDSDLSDDLRRDAQGRLGIDSTSLDEEAAKGPPVTQLSQNYSELGELLDNVVSLRGKYIILPNVSEGGRHTVLTDGGHTDFKKMPYVGGYLDNGQNVSTYGSKNKSRTSGNNPQWSDRKIYPLPTSDCRSSDYASLGSNNTWIKLAEPTTESIRQSFLGHPSRICIASPQTPSLYVSNISINEQTILLPTEITLSSELNSVIGGRGSGKSSFLEYLAFALGRSSYDHKREEYSNTSRMHDLIYDSVITNSATITIRIVQDNAEFVVSRSSANSYQPDITYPDGEKQAITVKELRELFPAVVYSQGELAEIGKQTGQQTQLTDLLQFVNPDYKRDDIKCQQGITESKNEVKKSILKLTENWVLKEKIRKLKTEKSSTVQRVEALEKSLPELSDEDKEIINTFEKSNDFESKRVQASKHAERILADLKIVADELLDERDLDSDLTDDEVTNFQNKYKTLYDSFKLGISDLSEKLTSDYSSLSASEGEWSQVYAAAKVSRNSVLEKFGEHQTVTNQIIKLREVITDLTIRIGDNEALLRELGDPSDGLKDAIKSLHKISTERASQTQKWASEIEELSSGKIKAHVNLDGDISELSDAVDVIASKTGSQEATRQSNLAKALSTDSFSTARDQLRTDCLSILHWKLVGTAIGEDAPSSDYLTKIIGDTPRIKNSLFENMDSARAEAIATSISKPEITLSYCDGTREIAFEKASEGQRATALLFMLLEQSGGPLIVDQPEGDLDNKVITELSEKLHLAKQKRQIVFASHNANIVVNGSSELVACIDINDDGDREFGNCGAIDNSSVREVITLTMEGGKTAFKDRQNKYGY